MTKRFSGVSFPLIFFAALLWSSILKAQVPEGNDSTHTESVEIVFEQTKPKRKKPKKSPHMHLLKLNPTLIANGEIPIYYERRISNNMSLEFGLGPTMYDFLRMYFTGDNQQPGQPLVKETVTADGNAVFGVGFTFKSALRYYPEGRAYFPDGLFFAPEFRFKQYYYTYEVPEYYVPGGRSIKAGNRFADALFVVGKQEEIEAPLYLEYYAGIGVRFRNIQNIERSYGNNGEYLYEVSMKKNPVPLLSIGLKIGLNL